MTTASPREFTQLLQAWSKGDENAFRRLAPMVYGELHRVAHRLMRGERPHHSLQTTGLVHEVYLRLHDASGLEWQSREHFWAVCARLMRRILVDFARSRRAQKRGGDALVLPLDSEPATGAPSRDIADLDEALQALEKLDKRKANVVELRFFGGYGVAETAEVLGVSPETVIRDWKFARAWLLRELSGEASP